MVLSCSYVEKFVRDNPLPQYSSRICKLQNRTWLTVMWKLCCTMFL